MVKTLMERVPSGENPLCRGCLVVKTLMERVPSGENPYGEGT